MNLREWLKKNHPDILKSAEKVMKERPTWDLADVVDEIDPDVYYYFCENVS